MKNELFSVYTFGGGTGSNHIESPLWIFVDLSFKAIATTLPRAVKVAMRGSLFKVTVACHARAIESYQRIRDCAPPPRQSTEPGIKARKLLRIFSRVDRAMMGSLTQLVPIGRCRLLALRPTHVTPNSSPGHTHMFTTDEPSKGQLVIDGHLGRMNLP
jgi:hypothetical protein